MFQWHSSHIDYHNYHSAKYMTDNSDDMLLARLGEVGCQERTHIESHLTEHNRGLAEIQQGWENTLMLYFSYHCYGEGENTTWVGKNTTRVGKKQQEWEKYNRGGKKHTKRGEKHKKGEMKGD